ncbi:MAG: hemolysin family protein [Flavobacteriaceae bacterium]
MLIFSAFFSGMEIAYVSSNKVFLEIQKQKKDVIARVLSVITLKPSKFIATMLIGNNIALVVYGFLMGDLLVGWFASLLPAQNKILNYLLIDLSLFSQTVISTAVILLTAEFIPKVFFQIYANTFVRFFAIPSFVFYKLFSWISDFVIWISDTILKKFFKTEGDQVNLALTRDELGNYISEQIESMDESDDVDSEIQIFQNALEFPELKAREVMIPRTEILAVDYLESLEKVTELFISSGYSKIIVYKNSIDDILGYVHAFELFNKPKNIRSIIRPVEFVPETILIKDVMNFLIKKRKSVAVVIDEYGGTSGIMTIEDIVEELFGEIEDEHDSVDLIENQLSDTEFIFSARLDVDYINEHYKLELPEDEHYETLGGLIVSRTEEIPSVGDELIIEKFKFCIKQVSSTKIDTVHLFILP